MISRIFKYRSWLVDSRSIGQESADQIYNMCMDLALMVSAYSGPIGYLSVDRPLSDRPSIYS
jgi:endonuclease III-like uncharacterized protein